MKTFLIMRHAKSDYPPHISNDFDRPLNKRGAKDVPRMARVLRASAPVPELILSSPAQRARQTAEGMELSGNILFDERLYLAAPATLIDVVAGLPDSGESALIVGHNPGLEEWILQLCGCHLRLPTAGLAALCLDMSRWVEIHSARGQLQWFVNPRLVKSIT